MSGHLEKREEIGVSSEEKVTGRNEGNDSSGGQHFEEVLGSTEGHYSGVQMASELDQDEEKLLKDSVPLLKIFPEEVWIMIFESVEDPSVKENFLNASLFFRSIVKDKRVQFLFPKVWKILAKQFHEKYNTDNSFNETRPDMMDAPCCRPNPNPDHRRTPCGDCGKLHGVKWYSGILRLRQVCESWNRAIDQLFQNEEERYQCNDDPQGQDDRFGSWISYSITDDNHHNRDFLQHFGGTHGETEVETGGRNPFLNRAISICYQGIIPFLSYFDHMSGFLRAYGTHVLYCSIKISRLPEALQGGFAIIFTVALMMPNLKLLSIDYLPPYGNEVTPEVYNEMITQPMLSLRNLQFLSVKNLSILIFNELIRSNTHLSMLQVGNCGPHQHLAIYSTEMPNLTQLALEFRSDADFQTFRLSPQVNWPLQKLSLDFRQCRRLNHRGVLDLLGNKWSNTLTELILDLQREDFVLLEDSNGIFDGCSPGILNLPYLTRLELLMPGFFSLDFILPCRDSLEILVVTVQFKGAFKAKGNQDLAAAAEKDKKIKWLSCGDRPLESNIWTLFPKLKQLTFNGTRYPYSRSSKVKVWNHTRREWINEMNRYKQLYLNSGLGTL